MEVQDVGNDRIWLMGGRQAKERRTRGWLGSCHSDQVRDDGDLATEWRGVDGFGVGPADGAEVGVKQKGYSISFLGLP